MAILTIMDNRIGYPRKVDRLPEIKEGYISFNGERREVCEIHSTTKGVQLELFS